MAERLTRQFVEGMQYTEDIDLINLQDPDEVVAVVTVRVLTDAQVQELEALGNKGSTLTLDTQTGGKKSQQGTVNIMLERQVKNTAKARRMAVAYALVDPDYKWTEKDIEAWPRQWVRTVSGRVAELSGLNLDAKPQAQQNPTDAEAESFREDGKGAGEPGTA